MWGLFGPVRVFVWPLNPMRHNILVVSAWGGEGEGEGEGGGSVCDVPHQIGEKVFDAIYVKALLNQVDAF